MPTDLFNIELDEVSLVSSGDNPAAEIVLSKAQPSSAQVHVPDPLTSTPDPKQTATGTTCGQYTASSDGSGMCATCGQMESKHTANISKDNDETSANDLISATDAALDQAIDLIKDTDTTTLPAEVQQALALVTSAGGSIDSAMDALGIFDPDKAGDNDLTTGNTGGGKATVMKGGNVGLTDEQKAIIDSLPEDQQSLFAPLIDETKPVGKSESVVDDTTEDDATDDEVLAKANPEIRRVIEKARNETAQALEIAKAAQAEAEAERDIRVHSEMVAKAAEFKNLTGTAEEKAEVLKSAYAVSAENGQTIENMMKAANAQLDDAGDIFRAVGKAAPGAVAGAEAEVEGKASELVKFDPTLSIEQARTRIFKAEPRLYEDYMKETANGR